MNYRGFVTLGKKWMLQSECHWFYYRWKSYGRLKREAPPITFNSLELCYCSIVWFSCDLEACILVTLGVELARHSWTVWWIVLAAMAVRCCQWGLKLLPRAWMWQYMQLCQWMRCRRERRCLIWCASFTLKVCIVRLMVVPATVGVQETIQDNKWTWVNGMDMFSGRNWICRNERQKKKLLIGHRYFSVQESDFLHVKGHN
jgi:hypothetical protein